MLDLAGYTPDKQLHLSLIIEPSSGDGSFLLAIVRRLMHCCERFRVSPLECLDSVRAYEIDESSARKSRQLTVEVLAEFGVDREEAKMLAERWIRTGDFLLGSQSMRGEADYVIGNPPYIRMEDLENGGAMYRSMFPTMVGRSDIYVAFFEAALRCLKREGVCGFICADRWMFNQYGAELRKLITGKFAVEYVLQMHHADAFDREVSAYPAITIIRNSSQGKVQIATMGADAERNSIGQTQFSEFDSWFRGSEPWPLIDPDKLLLLRRIEDEFIKLEDSGALVGIGVATGADKIFITKDTELVEKDRLLPLAMARDIQGQKVEWSGHYLVNPWQGKDLVDLSKYPKLSAYFAKHRLKLEARHVGKKSTATWYRTIDRVNHELTEQPKLYLPDFKGRIAPVLDCGQTYPHHNLYVVVPKNWNAEVLGGLLISDLAQFFIEAYCVRMRGGFLRFQAQYLRRLRVPKPESLSHLDEEELKRAFQTHDVTLANTIAARLYRLTEKERNLISNG